MQLETVESTGKEMKNDPVGWRRRACKGGIRVLIIIEY